MPAPATVVLCWMRLLPHFSPNLERAVSQQALRLTDKKTWHKSSGECIRAGEVIDIVRDAQNRLIADGWITTRVILQTEGAAGQRDFRDFAGFKVNQGDGVAALVADGEPGFVGAAGEGADGDR